MNNLLLMKSILAKMIGDKERFTMLQNVNSHSLNRVVARLFYIFVGVPDVVGINSRTKSWLLNQLRKKEILDFIENSITQLPYHLLYMVHNLDIEKPSIYSIHDCAVSHIEVSCDLDLIGNFTVLGTT